MKCTITICAAAAAFALTGLLSAQNPPDFPATPHPGTGSTVSDPNPVATPGLQRTPLPPGAGFAKSDTSGTTPRMPDQDRARATPTSGSNMPTGYPGMNTRGPAAAADCANNGWSSYANPKFKSRKNCEAWARSHGARAGPHGAAAPRPAAESSGAKGHSPARTPTVRATPFSPRAP